MAIIRKVLGISALLLFLIAELCPASAQIVQTGSFTIDLGSVPRLNPDPAKSFIFETDQELLTNPGFESGNLNPWYSNGGWQISSGAPHSGSFCARDSDNFWIRQDFPPIPAAQIASMTFWEKQPYAQVSAVDIIYQDGSFTENIVFLTTVWEQYNVTSWIQPGQTVTGIRIYGFSSSLPPPWITFIDDVSVQTTGGSSGWDINITPINPPIVIPHNGGTFQYNVNVHNLGTTPGTFQVWNKVRQPDNSFVQVFGPVTRTLPGGASPTRTMTQTIAGTIEDGLNTYISYVGTYPTTIADSSYFTFSKRTLSDNSPWIAESGITGDFFEDFAMYSTSPEEFRLLQNHPNPFNPTTTLHYELPTASFVKLSVYDISGKKVAALVNGMREAGSHEVTFDGSELTSGVYLYRLEASGSGATPTIMTGKMVLLK